MSKRIQKILATAARAEEEEKKDPAETPEETPAAEDPEEKPAEEPEAPADEKPAEPVDDKPAEPEAPAEEPAEEPEEKKDEDKEDGAQAAVLARLAALEARLSALDTENARLRGMLRDPAFAAANVPATVVPASVSDGSETLTREAADAAYAKLTDPRERAKFREAHRAELGLR